MLEIILRNNVYRTQSSILRVDTLLGNRLNGQTAEDFLTPLLLNAIFQRLHRQKDAKARTDAEGALHLDAPAMVRDDTEAH